MAAPGSTSTGVVLALPGADGIPLTDPRVPAREAAERELSDQRYQEQEPSLPQRVFDEVWDGMNDLLDAASGAAPGGAVGLATIVLFLALAATALRLRLGPLRRAPERGAPAFAAGPPLSAAEHRTAAQRHADAGRWNAACQERVRAVIRALEEHGLLEPSPGRTAGEAATQAGAALPGVAERLHAAARSFEAVRYGGHQANERTYTRLTALDQDLRNALPTFTTSRSGSR
ncbi:DUF4129 domain-containing protein [Streptomyces sp. NPDC018031]|uniref:DUF4129 domain-containing protein n=1 Tax=Streptomyces sp. NPDC018031 TaxID=3365033 RepID=UPI003790F84F